VITAAMPCRTAGAAVLAFGADPRRTSGRD
jgi:hypothetical protein